MGGDLPAAFCLLGLGVEGLAEVGVAFFKPLIALVSEERESWIFCRSRLSGCGGRGRAGALPSSISSLIMG